MKAFFVAYHSAFEEISRSQVLPYVYGLSKQGVGFRLISFEKSPLDAAAARELEQELAAHGVSWTRLRYHKKPRLLAKIFDHLVGTLAISYLILKHKPDIIHMRGVMACCSALLPSRLLSVKALFDVRSELADEYVGGGLLRHDSIVYRTLKGFQHLCCRWADRLVVLTARHKLYLQDLGIRKDVTIIPCCVDTDRFRRLPAVAAPERLKGRFVIVYHGKIGSWYMFDEMLDFLRCARQAVSEAHLLVLTQTPERDFSRRIIDRRLEEDVSVLHPRFEDIPSYLSGCKAGLMFIQPYRKFASSPIKLGECLSCGVPVVINAGIGDTEEFLSRHAVGVVVRSFRQPDYQESFSRLLALLRDPDLPRRCRDTALAELPLSLALDRYGAIYRSLGG